MARTGLNLSTSEAAPVPMATGAIASGRVRRRAPETQSERDALTLGRLLVPVLGRLLPDFDFVATNVSLLVALTQHLSNCEKVNFAVGQPRKTLNMVNRSGGRGSPQHCHNGIMELIIKGVAVR